ncbi:sugar ABC transporter permease [Paenibacillus antri]|uniref:Sugar ABC transporter permease n=1 Tax=Paenibacillus antri TaxID=2582848 RepID=A0A5R9G642_9BACL|nr:sugar ABC transporter permease [Paenibacillus antri]TLS51847.1 sugar ABC transporter permease [Paenibacillus antri]
MHSVTEVQTNVSRKRKRRGGRMQRMESLAGFLFVSPMLLGVTVMVLLPIVAALYLSFTEWSMITGIEGIKWIGTENFDKLFHDTKFLKGLRNNAIFLLTVPVYLAISLILAVLINKFVYMKGFFKVIYFLPYISSVVAVATVWRVLFHPSMGPVNQFLMSVGIDNPPKWIADPQYALVSVMMISVWISIGYNMIVYMAGLQSIPRDLYEAADIDGANGFVRFFRITLPMLSPTTFFLLITGIIYTFKVFDIIAVLTAGGPAGSTNVIVYYLYETAFINLKIGYASSQAIFLFLCVLVITFVQWVGQKKWVNY